MGSNEHTEDELHIVKAQDRVAALSADAFQRPISDLKTSPAVTLDASAPAGDAVRVMKERRFGSVLVVRGGRLAGIVTERDVLNKLVGRMDELKGRPVSEIMTPDPLSLRPDEPIAHAMHAMHVGGYRHVPIVDGSGAPLTVVSIRDVLTFILDHFPADVVNTVSEPYRGPSEREGA